MNSNPIFSSLNNVIIIPSSNYPLTPSFITYHPIYYGLNPSALCSNNRKPANLRARAVNDISTVTTSVPAEVTWQIVVGSIAGVAPFVVAGIEFSKRIVEQRNCKVCKGSGLVLRDKKYYFRCPGCGGFLPWQSWRRFFTG